MKTKKTITLTEFKNLHNKRTSKTLTPFEKYKIRCTLKNPTEENILIHLYTKFLSFNFREFHQRKFDIQVGVGSYTDITIMRNLDSLEKKGYFTQEFKQVKGKNYNRTHFIINIEKMNEFMTTGDDLKPENFSNLIENLRREHEVVKANPINTKKTIEKSTDEIEEPTEPLKRSEDIRRELDETLDEKLENRAKAKAIIASKANPKIEDYLDKLKLTNYDIHYLLSNDYVDGSDGELDDKKRILNLVADNLIKI